MVVYQGIWRTLTTQYGAKLTKLFGVASPLELIPQDVNR